MNKMYLLKGTSSDSHAQSVLRMIYQGSCSFLLYHFRFSHRAFVGEVRLNKRWRQVAQKRGDEGREADAWKREENGQRRNSVSQAELIRNGISGQRFAKLLRR